MPLHLTRRTFTASLAATAVTGILPAPAMATISDPLAAVKATAAKSTISELEYCSFMHWSRCKSWSDVVHQRGTAPLRSSLVADTNTDDVNNLQTAIAIFEVVAAEFFARPSPTPYYIERKRFLLYRVAYDRRVSDPRLVARVRGWRQLVAKDTARLEALTDNPSSLPSVPASG